MQPPPQHWREATCRHEVLESPEERRRNQRGHRKLPRAWRRLNELRCRHIQPEEKQQGCMPARLQCFSALPKYVRPIHRAPRWYIAIQHSWRPESQGAQSPRVGIIPPSSSIRIADGTPQVPFKLGLSVSPITPFPSVAPWSSRLMRKELRSTRRRPGCLTSCLTSVVGGLIGRGTAELGERWERVLRNLCPLSHAAF